MVDPLTGLKNRRFLKAFIPEELALAIRQQHAQPPLAVGGQARNIDLCVMLVDLDHFKSVNDSHGHGAGDAVLRQVGEVLRAACRASDVVVRCGGEEFLILARNADRHQAKVLATQVCAAVRAHAFDLGKARYCTRPARLASPRFPSCLPSLKNSTGNRRSSSPTSACTRPRKAAGMPGSDACCSATHRRTLACWKGKSGRSTATVSAWCRVPSRLAIRSGGTCHPQAEKISKKCDGWPALCPGFPDARIWRFVARVFLPTIRAIECSLVKVIPAPMQWRRGCRPLANSRIGWQRKCRGSRAVASRGYPVLPGVKDVRC